MDEYELQVLGYIQPKKFFDKQTKSKKEKITRYQMFNMLRRTQRMFDWKGDERFFERISPRNMELMIQIRGLIGIIFHEGYFYSVWGGLGGKPNWDYMPMNYIVANPYLKLSETYNIYDEDGSVKKDVVIIPNDSLYQGLLPILSYHSELLTEVQLTKLCILKNNRTPNIVTAPDNNAKRDLDEYFNDLDEGKIASVYDKNILKNIGSIPLNDGSSRNVMTQVLEMEQYQKAAMFNDIGLQMNYNMKRESITSSEAQLGEGALLPLCDDMYEMRRIACKQIKDTFDVNVTCEFSSAWKNLHQSIEVELEVEKSEVVNNTQGETAQSEEVQSTEQGESGRGDLGDMSNDSGVSNDVTDSENESNETSSPVPNDEESSTGEMQESEQANEKVNQTVQLVVNVGDVQSTEQGEDNDEKETT